MKTGNPILAREFVGALRTWRSLAMVSAVMVALGAYVLLLWPEGGVYSMAAQASQKLFVSLSLALLTLVCLCAPAFTAVSITHEKEQATYDFLYHTLLSPWQIMTGKLVAGVGTILLFIAASLPMMGACFMLGGITVRSFVSVYLIVVAAALLFGLLGLLISTFARSSFQSLIVCYAAILSVCGLTWVPSIVLGAWAERVHAIHFIRGFSPFAAMVSIVQPDQFASEHPFAASGFGRLADSMWVFLGFAALAAAGIATAALARIVVPPQPKQRRDTELIDERLELMKRHVKFPFYLLDPKKRKRMIGAILNIILAKEMRSKAFGRSVWVIRSMYALIVASLLLAFLPLGQIAVIGIDTVVMTCVSLPLGMILLISPVLSSPAIAEEHEKGVFDMLRCTLLRPRTIVTGKLQVSCFFLVLLLAATLPTFFVLAYVSTTPSEMEHLSEGINLIRPFRFQFREGWAHLSQVDLSFLSEMGAAFAVVLTAMLTAVSASTFVSSLCRRTSTATAVSYALVLAWAVGTLLPALAAGNMPESVVNASLQLNPFVAAADAVSADITAGLQADLWVANIRLLLTACILFGGASWLRVAAMMRPSK
ncbi:MAG: ABC transporter permease [Verrucomicrobiota bacterium]